MQFHETQLLVLESSLKQPWLERLPRVETMEQDDQRHLLRLVSLQYMGLYTVILKYHVEESDAAAVCMGPSSW